MAIRATDKAGINTPVKKAFMSKTHRLMSSTLHLDTCAQEHVFIDRNMLSDLRPCVSNITLSGITDSTGESNITSTACGMFHHLQVYLVPGASANLISYGKLLESGHTVVSGGKKGNQLFVYTPTGELFLKAKSVGRLMIIFNILGKSVRDISNHADTLPYEGVGKVYAHPCNVNHLSFEEIFGISSPSDPESESDPTPTPTPSPTTDDMIPFGELLGALLTKSQRRIEETKDLYDALGRPSMATFKDMLKNNQVTGTDLTTQDVIKAESYLDVDGARAGALAQNKIHKVSISPPVSGMGQLIYADIVYDDYRNPYLLTHDRDTMFRTLTNLTSKSSTHLTIAFVAIIATYQSYSISVKHVATDNEITFRACKSVLGEKGVRMTFVPSGQHAQIVERSWRTIKEKALTLKNSLDYLLHPILEHTVLRYSVYLLNRIPNQETYPDTPWYLLTGDKLNLKLNPLIPYGTIGVFYQHHDLRTKSHPSNAEIGIVVGKLSDTPTGFQVYIPARDEIVIRGNNFSKLDGPPKEWNLSPNPFKVSKLDLSNDDRERDTGFVVVLFNSLIKELCFYS